MPTQKLSLTQAENLLTQYRKSNLSRKVFAQKHDISLSLFAYWIPLFQKHKVKKPPPFQELTIPSTIHSSCTLTLPSGAKLEFPSSQLTSALATLMASDVTC
jgi:hypothetical protein